MSGFHGLSSAVESRTWFGSSLAALPPGMTGSSCRGSCRAVLAVGASAFSIEAGQSPGAVFVLSLNSTGYVVSSLRIMHRRSADLSVRGVVLPLPAGSNSSSFGRALAWIGDANGDGEPELAVAFRPTLENTSIVNVAVIVSRHGTSTGAFAGSSPGEALLRGRAFVLNGSTVPRLHSTVGFGSSLAEIPDPSGGCGTHIGLLIGQESYPGPSLEQAGAVWALALDPTTGHVSYANATTWDCCNEDNPDPSHLHRGHGTRMGSSIAVGNFSGGSRLVVAAGAMSHVDGHGNEIGGVLLLDTSMEASLPAISLGSASSSGFASPSPSPSPAQSPSTSPTNSPRPSPSTSASPTVSPSPSGSASPSLSTSASTSISPAPLLIPTWFRLLARGQQGAAFNSLPSTGGNFGVNVANIGDIDASGTEDLAVTEQGNHDVFVLRTSQAGDGSIISIRNIGGTNGFSAGIRGGSGAKFGSALAGLG